MEHLFDPKSTDNYRIFSQIFARAHLNSESSSLHEWSQRCFWQWLQWHRIRYRQCFRQSLLHFVLRFYWWESCYLNNKSLSPTNHFVDMCWVQTPEMQTLKLSKSVVLIFCWTLICTISFRWKLLLALNQVTKTNKQKKHSLHHVGVSNSTLTSPVLNFLKTP